MEFSFHQVDATKLNRLKQNVKLHIKYSGIYGTMIKVGVDELIWLV